MKQRKLTYLLLIVLLATLLAACSDPRRLSKEPTDFLISDGYGEHRISYVTDKHPDVQAVTDLVERFLAIDQTQDYRNPTYADLRGYVDQSLLDSRKTAAAKEIGNHLIIKELIDWEITSIIFTGSKLQLDMASVTAEVSVVFASATADYAKRNGITLNKPTTLRASLTLKNRDTVSFVPNSLKPQVDPYGWSVGFARYNHISP